MHFLHSLIHCNDMVVFHAFVTIKQQKYACIQFDKLSLQICHVVAVL